MNKLISTGLLLFKSVGKMAEIRKSWSRRFFKISTVRAEQPSGSRWKEIRHYCDIHLHCLARIWWQEEKNHLNTWETWNLRHPSPLNASSIMFGLRSTKRSDHRFFAVFVFCQSITSTFLISSCYLPSLEHLKLLDCSLQPPLILYHYASPLWAIIICIRLRTFYLFPENAICCDERKVLLCPSLTILNSLSAKLTMNKELWI